MKYLFWLFLLGSATGWSQNSSNISAHYSLGFNKKNIREITVEATLPMTNDSLYMPGFMADDLPDGWAHYVKDLKAETTDGKRLEIKSIGKSLWSVTGAKTIKLSYKVSIEHDYWRWKVSGSFARAYATDSLLFFTGRVLFIVPRSSDAYLFTVKYNLPDEWKVVTAYKQDEPKSNIYSVNGRLNLLSNGNMVGDIEQEEVTFNDITIEFASPKGTKQSMELLSKTLVSAIETYDKLLGGSPKGKFAIFTTTDPFDNGGEAFNNSISMRLRELPSLQNKEGWSYTVPHEIFHLWNGSANGIQPENSQPVEWFVEGFTDFTTLITEQRIGLMNTDDFLNQLNMRYRLLTSANLSISLMDAGKEKGRNYNFIYYGGMFLALAIDIELLTATNGEKRFFDFMKIMYDRFGKTGKRYNYSDILMSADEFKNTNIKSLIEKYTQNPGTVPIEHYLEKIGITSDPGQTTVFKCIQNPTVQQEKLFKAILQ